jgi:hypothetical protein
VTDFEGQRSAAESEPVAQAAEPVEKQEIDAAEIDHSVGVQSSEEETDKK